MGKPASHPPELAVAVLVLMTTIALFAALPPFVSMGLAVIAAVSWCIWLDRHSTS
jgi:hypothetical protein